MIDKSYLLNQGITIVWSKRQFSMWLCIGILSSGSKSIPTTILGMSRIKPNKAYQTGTEMKKEKMWKWPSKGLFWWVYPWLYIIGTQQLGPVHCLRSYIYPKYGAGVGLYQPEWADRNRVKVQNLILSFFGGPGLSFGLGPGVSYVLVLVCTLYLFCTSLMRGFRLIDTESRRA